MLRRLYDARSRARSRAYRDLSGSVAETSLNSGSSSSAMVPGLGGGSLVHTSSSSVLVPGLGGDSPIYRSSSSARRRRRQKDQDSKANQANQAEEVSAGGHAMGPPGMMRQAMVAVPAPRVLLQAEGRSARLCQYWILKSEHARRKSTRRLRPSWVLVMSRAIIDVSHRLARDQPRRGAVALLRRWAMLESRRLARV